MLFRFFTILLGDTKECTEFTKNFLERRNKYKSEQRALNVHTDDLCQPAPAVTPSNENIKVITDG